MSKNLHNSKILRTFAAEFVHFCQFHPINGPTTGQPWSNNGPLTVHSRVINGSITGSRPENDLRKTIERPKGTNKKII